MRKVCIETSSLQDNPAACYAAIRSSLYRMGHQIELLVNYEPSLHYLAEWWKQLFGESEGKENEGLFPAAVDNTSDLVLKHTKTICSLYLGNRDLKMKQKLYGCE